ncbi:RCC1/BLIP-II protein [Athelia psychrophila]|uniref:RCC1/BLIP-II protein n=1 Tax=Athelia psychrophila TaxID=1759441 RepID=A0A165YT80_9AGAM|nr:RCC1/BLIP-II protein [Fibularhizoctonia sp. CBS 109695]
MPSIFDIPVDILLDNLLPIIDIPDLLSLSSTNRFFAILGADETFWRRRLQDDFNFSGAGTARTSAWKTIYKGMRKPNIYTWGQKANGRLGLTSFPDTTLSDVPYPVRIQIPGARIVSLVAGGTSFHALDSRGNVWAWGTMDGETHGLRSDGYGSPHAKLTTPHKLSLPLPTKSLSCGRFHAACLDSEGKIWNLVNWGRPYRLVCDYITAAKSKPVQIDCGWRFSSMLNKAGDVFIWFPFDERPWRAVTEHEAANSAKILDINENEIPCATWDLHQDTFKLPPLPDLPSLSASAESEDTVNLVKIAGFDNCLIGLTNHGHVLLFDQLASETSAKAGQWTYLPRFSEPERLKEHPTFSNAGQHSCEVSETMQITHISAHFRTFFAYSTGHNSVVIMGDADTNASSTPNVIPELQNKGVISVVLGDYHFGALTEDGKLLTWGQYSQGALGLGDPASLEPGQPGGFSTDAHRQMALSRRRGSPPEVTVPTAVRFDHQLKGKRDMFCFAATASGWHMGALVIDLETNKEEDDDSESENQHMPGHFDTPPAPPASSRDVPLPGGHPSFAGLGFRVGFAGRGMMRGGPSHRGFGQ